MWIGTQPYIVVYKAEYVEVSNTLLFNLQENPLFFTPGRRSQINTFNQFQRIMLLKN